MKEIYIFDIDDCILPAVFPNLDDNSMPREKVIKDTLEKGKYVSLFPEFMEYYEKYCKNAVSIFFLTGRQEREFSELTEMHLMPLKKIKPFQIIYYPAELSHTSKEYFEWKVKQIQEILIGKFNQELSDENLKKNFIFKIFDDITDYFPRVQEIAGSLGLNISLISIDSSKKWLTLI